VVYTETLFNLTGMDDSFGIEIAGNAWTTTLSISDTGLIADGGSIDFSVQIEIPAGLSPGASDEVVIEAIPLGTLDLYSDTATLSTNVFRPGYVFDAGDDTINVVDTVSHQGTGLLIDTSPYGGWPWRGALSPGGQWLYASLLADDRVLVISATTHTPVTALDVGSGPHGIAFSADGALAFVADQGPSPSDPGDDTVSVIDTAVPTVTAVITVGDRPMSIGSSPYLDKVYVTNRNDSAVSVVDVGALSIKDVITGLDYPWDIVISPLGDRAYVTNQGSNEAPGAGSIGVIDTDDDVLIATWPIAGAVWIAGLDVSPDGRKLYVADALAGVTHVLDTSTGQALAALPTGPHDDNSLEVEIFPTWAGPFAYVSNPFGGVVAVVNTDTGDVLGRIPMSDQPRGLALFAPDIVPGQPPTAAFTPTVSVRFAGQAVNLTNQSTGVPRPSYQWDFGDESPLSAAANPAHVYNITGTFTVVLTATNSFGQDTATGLVQVTPPPYGVYLPLLLRDAP
jgi:YVTN family beta-propeller protein